MSGALISIAPSQRFFTSDKPWSQTKSSARNVSTSSAIAIISSLPGEFCASFLGDISVALPRLSGLRTANMANHRCPNLPRPPIFNSTFPIPTAWRSLLSRATTILASILSEFAPTLPRRKSPNAISLPERSPNCWRCRHLPAPRGFSAAGPARKLTSKLAAKDCKSRCRVSTFRYRPSSPRA